MARVISLGVNVGCTKMWIGRLKIACLPHTLVLPLNCRGAQWQIHRGVPTRGGRKWNSSTDAAVEAASNAQCATWYIGHGSEFPLWLPFVSIAPIIEFPAAVVSVRRAKTALLHNASSREMLRHVVTSHRPLSQRMRSTSYLAQVPVKRCGVDVLVFGPTIFSGRWRFERSTMV